MGFDLFIPGARTLLATVTAGLTGTIVYHYLTTKYFNNEEDTKLKKAHVIHLEVPKDAVAYFIGRNGETIKKIELDNCVSISFIDSSNVNCKLTVIRGSNKEGIETAKEQLLELAQEFTALETAEIVVSQKILNVLTASDSLRMREIAASSKTRIYQYSLPDGKTCSLLVRGNFLNVENARKLLKSLAEEEVIEETRAMKLSLTPTIASSSSFSSFKISQTPSFEILEATSFDGFCEVMISAVDSPSKFFVQKGGPCSKDLDRLIESMTEFYENEENRMRLPLANVERGSLAAAYISSDKNWYRAKVTSVNDEGSETLYHISLLDFGDDVIVGDDSLATLDADFLKLKFQAVECQLANVYPAGGGTHWTEDATELFDRLTYCTQWKIIMAKVESFTQVDERQIYCVKLIDTNTDKDINIAQELIDQGFGVLSTSS